MDREGDGVAPVAVYECTKVVDGGSGIVAGLAGWLVGQVQEAYSVGLRVLMVLLGSCFS